PPPTRPGRAPASARTRSRSITGRSNRAAIAAPASKTTFASTAGRSRPLTPRSSSAWWTSRANTAGARRASPRRGRYSDSEHDPEKWIPVFGKDHAPCITPDSLYHRRNAKMSNAGSHEAHGRSQTKKAAASGWIGSALEYYDFFIYATAASLIFPQIFFPSDNPTVAIVASL